MSGYKIGDRVEAVNGEQTIEGEIVFVGELLINVAVDGAKGAVTLDTREWAVAVTSPGEGMPNSEGIWQDADGRRLLVAGVRGSFRHYLLADDLPIELVKRHAPFEKVTG